MIVRTRSVTSTQFLQIQKKYLNELQEHLERQCKILPAFGFNSAKYDLSLIKSCSLPILVKERDIEPFVIKKVNQFISFKFGNIQLLDIMIYNGGARSLYSFMKAYKTSETKSFHPTKGLIALTKCRIQNFPHMTPFTVTFAAAILSKLITRTMLIYWKLDWPQNKPPKTIKATPYWDWELSIPATNLEAWTNVLIHSFLR